MVSWQRLLSFFRHALRNRDLPFATPISLRSRISFSPSPSSPTSATTLLEQVLLLFNLSLLPTSSSSPPQPHSTMKFSLAALALAAVASASDVVYLTKNTFTKTTNADGLTLVGYTTSWCGECSRLACLV